MYFLTQSAKNHALVFFLSLLSGLLFYCSPQKEQPRLMELLPAEYTGIEFSNQLNEDENLNIITFEYFYNGAGVGIGDFNNDGLNDIFFAANMSKNRLYLNKGDLHFEDITDNAGITFSGKWATGVSIVDINQDSLMDIYVCYAGPFSDARKRANELYINLGNNVFIDQAQEYGLADTGHSVQAAFFDFDRDGDLDVYILTNTTNQTGPNVIRPKQMKGEMINTDRLYRNNGNKTFTNISVEAGITIEGYGLGISICDINRDSWPDVYVTNDYLSNDLLYINNHDGTFTNRMSEYFKHTSYSAMGNDVSDFNNDGLLDIIAVDMLPPDNKRQKMMFGSINYDRYQSELQYGYTPQFMRNTLQLNVGESISGQPQFSEIGQLAGIEATDWSWSPLFADIDNDGWKDLLITNGYARDITNRDFANFKMQEFLQQGYNESVKKKLLKSIQSIEGAYLPIFALRNNGDYTFSDQSAYWGFTKPAYSTGAAYSDLDNDGDLDYVTNNINSPAFVFENHSNEILKNTFLKIMLNGSASNRQGYGTKVLLYTASDTVQYQENSPYRGYQSTIEEGLHFGLGKKNKVDSILIRWPDDKQQVLKNVKANQTIYISYYDAEPGTSNSINRNKNPDPLFVQVNKDRNIFYRHQETEYADFKILPLLPHKYSENGPGIAVADVNNDGLEDFFVGGAYNQSGQFFIQHKDGKFTSKQLMNKTKYEEDMGVLLFDADGDQDQDLYVVSGGNEFSAGSVYYQDRLYLNDGNGNFTYDALALPRFSSSGSCVIAADYDHDGDLDLFIGSRLVPQHYPQPGESYLLENRNGKFYDVTDQVAPGLRHIGLVTAALWTDTNNDNYEDLIVVGEWMPVTIFKNEHGKFAKPFAIANSSGWWNSIEGADFDKDGDTDYILGNLGLNTKYKTSARQPVSLYLDDYNHDGTQDPIMAYYIQGINRPAHSRDDLLQQITQFKKKYPSYKSYSEATIETLIAETNTHPTIFQIQTFQTSYLENRMQEEWQLSSLPTEAQFGPVFGIITDDYNGDGHTDIMLCGNSYATEVLTGRYDALKGLLLQGDGTGEFKPISTQQSGILIDGDAKGLAELIDVKGRELIIATQNNDSIKVFENAKTTFQFLPISHQDVMAIITYTNGKNSKHEFYFGSGYQSQSTRRLKISKDVKQVTIYKRQGNARTITF